ASDLARLSGETVSSQAWVAAAGSKEAGFRAEIVAAGRGVGVSCASRMTGKANAKKRMNRWTVNRSIMDEKARKKSTAVLIQLIHEAVAASPFGAYSKSSPPRNHL